MRFVKGMLWLSGVAVVLGIAAALLIGCEVDRSAPTLPEVQYLDQTFSLLVCDGNGGTAEGWDHDGAAVCTLDWNNDGSGPNRVPVIYVYDFYPIVDGRVTKEHTVEGKLVRGDKAVWDQAPWTTINVGPVYGKGSGIKQVKVKAVFTYVNPPRIWFLFQWEDPTHTIAGDPSAYENNPEKARAGVMQWHWWCKPGYTPPGDGFRDNRHWDSREDWLALVWSTWWAYNTNNRGKDKSQHKPADFTGYDWKFYETVPGFQKNGINALEKDVGDIAYRTKPVTTNDKNSPYYDKYYPGPYCDLWFFSASRSNYTSAGGWSDEEAANMFDCVINTTGFKQPPVGSNSNMQSLDEWLVFDSGVSGYVKNGGVLSTPGYMAPDDPGTDNPPGAPYLWSSSETTEEFDITSNLWQPYARIAGYMSRPALGSCSDILCRATWAEDLDQNGNYEYPYTPWLTPAPPRNEYIAPWTYTLEIEREIGFPTKIDPVEDVLLGIFESHPGQ